MAARRDAAPIYAPLSIVSLMDYTAAPERRRSQFTILWNTCGKANCTDDQLLSHLRKAICQHKFGSSKPPKPIDILVSETSGFYSVLSRPAFPSFAHFLVDHGKKIFVELWAEDDLSSPTHVFTNGAGGFFSANLLRVEARLVSSDGVATDKSCTFDARLCTDRCVRHFRKGFERQLAQKCGLPVDTPVEVHFKKPHGTATGYTPGSSKETFEFKVAQCLRQNDALQVQVRVKGSKDAAMDVDTTPEKLKQAAGKGDSSRMIKPIPATAVSATKPIWSSTESKIPGAWMNAGSSITTEPYATTSINASTSHTTATPINTVPLVDMRSSYKADSGPPPLPPKPIGVGSYERTIPGSFFGSSATTLATSSSVPAPAPKQNGNLNGETAAQTQEQQPVSYAAARDTVQTMLSSFLVELNRTLAANFGDDFSEVSMGGKEPASTSPAEKESPAESQYESAAQPAVEPKLATSGVVTAAGYAPVPPAQQPPEVKHNACCDVCGSSIKGIRHKCLTCPDWDCCDSCVSRVDAIHPGHKLVSVATLDAIPRVCLPESYLKVSHPNILCDGCDAQIVGPRFKCVACPDYDLCAKCEADPTWSHADQGDEHMFLKINKPVKSGTTSERVVQSIGAHARHGHHSAKPGPSSQPATAEQPGNNKRFSFPALVAAQSAKMPPVDKKQLRAIARSLRDADENVRATAPRKHREEEIAGQAIPVPEMSELRTKKTKLGGEKDQFDTPMEEAKGPAIAALEQKKDELAAALSKLSIEAVNLAAATRDAHARANAGKTGSVRLEIVGDGYPHRPTSADQALTFAEKKVLAMRITKAGRAAIAGILKIARGMDNVDHLDGEQIVDLDNLDPAQYRSLCDFLDRLEASESVQQPAMSSAATESFATASSAPVVQPADVAEAQPVVGDDRDSLPERPGTPPSVPALGCEFVCDGNMADGAAVAAGSRFDKVWEVRNTGSAPWPRGVRVQLIAGDRMGLSADASFAVPGGDMLMPGDHIEVRVSNLQARDTPGRSQSYWRMIAPAQSDAPDAFEERFGHQLWIDVEVVADGTQSGSAGSASLSGSSMFAPPHAPESVASPRSERTSASIAGQYHSAATQASLDTIIRSSLPPTIANTNVTTDEEWHSSTGLNSPASDAQSEEEDDPFESAEVVSDAESYEVIDETSSDEAD